MRVRDLLEVARWGVNRHGRLKHCGSVMLARTRVSSFYRSLSQKYQTNRNNGWSLYTVMMVLVRVREEGSVRRRLGPYVVSNTAVAANSHHVISKILPNRVICQRGITGPATRPIHTHLPFRREQTLTRYMAVICIWAWYIARCSTTSMQLVPGIRSYN